MKRKATDEDRIIELTRIIASKLDELFLEGKSMEDHIDLNQIIEDREDNLLFYALLNTAPAIIIQRITGNNDMDILDINHLANRLIVQYKNLIK